MTVQVERKGNVVVIRLNRPEVLNALNSDVMHELVALCKAWIGTRMWDASC